MEADHVGPEHPGQNLALPWTDAHHFAVRPWDMPEEADDRIGRELAQFRREQREVVILDQHQPVIARFLRRHFGEPAVDRGVGRPVRLPKNRPRVRGVAKGPETFVRESVVIALFLFLGEPYPPENVLGRLGRHAETPLGIRAFPIG
jgi:hypothetical protein